jgi:4-hydroxyacetophenone monooxygenase
MFGNALYHEKVGAGKKWCLRHLPYYARWLRFLMFWPAVDGALPAVEVDPDWPHQDRSVSEVNDMVRQMFTDYITEQVGDDEELLAHVIPDFPALGKRTLQDNGSWLNALKRDNVTLVTDPITAVNQGGVSCENGDYPVDVIVYGTGFEANRFLYPMDIVGKGGVKLSEVWAEEPEAYLGITVPNFPNLFCLFGPATNLAFGGSLIFNGECQMRYVMGCLKALLENGGGAMECKQEVCDDFNRRMRERHAGLVWEHEAINLGFYRNAKGHASILWPFKILEMWQWTRQPQLEDYNFEQ